MKTIELKLYSFEELSKEVQQRVIEKHRDINVDYEWYEYVTEEWKGKLNEQGFEGADIQFSGFYSQGDGASFDAEINIEKFITDKRLFNIVNKSSNDIKFFIQKNSYSNHYSHEKTRYVDFDTTGRKNIDEKLNTICDKIEALRLSLSREIYRELEKEYDYLTSDEQVKETILSNEYTFEENGTMRNI